MSLSRVYTDNKTQINVVDTNARSLRPKIKSFIQCFINLSLTFAIVTETWLAHGSRLELDAENLLLGHGLVVQYLNRPPSPNGVAHGGVAVVSKECTTKTKIYNFPNPECFEVLSVVVTVSTIKRKFYVIACYIPPNYTVARGKACLDHINNVVLDIKRKCQEPYLLLAGDFNQWPVQDALEDYHDITEVLTPPTREDRRIDRIFTNWQQEIVESGCLPPLETEGSAETRTYSDHRIQYICSRIERKDPVKRECFTYRPFNDKASEAFIAELGATDWQPVYQETTSNRMATVYQHIIDNLMDKHFPLKTISRKEDDLPWLDSKGKRMIRKKAAIYKSEGKSQRWENHMLKTEEYLEQRRQAFLGRQREKFSGPDAARNFFRNVKAYKSAEKPKEFDIRTLRPNCSEDEVAAEAAAFFNRISNEFSPLEPGQIPTTYHRHISPLAPADVCELILKVKKPNSMVRGDIFPKIVSKCAQHIAWPLSAIYNKILATYIWPLDWKREYVTIIPKKTQPEDFADLRNISCTLFISKVFEHFLLRHIKEEIELKPNQYGGVKGCSTTHMIIDILQEICDNAEDYRSATILCAIDYAKAFNRMSYQHCLEAFRKKGSSTPVLRLIASFLTNRTMTVRVGNSWSDPLPVSGGCPQGSILGVPLFNTTTDDLEDDYMAAEAANFGVPTMQAAAAEEPAAEEAREESPGPAISSPRGGFRIPLKITLSPVLSPPGQHSSRRPKVELKHVPQPIVNLPPRETKVGTQVLTSKMVKFFKYIDDNVSCEKANFGSVDTIVEGDQTIKKKHTIPTQNAFRCVTTKALEKGMVVNASKTGLLCVSDALNYRPQAFIMDCQDNVICSGTSLKILGFWFSDRPNVDLHVSKLITQLRRRQWVLNHLRSFGFNTDEWVKVYKSVLLPIADYCCPAYHSMLTDVQDQLLERAQIGALRAIFGYKSTATELRQAANVTTLRERRIQFTDKFAEKCASSERFKHWFPLADGRRSGRNSDKYKEFFAKNDRLKNSPLFYMRRRLNGKPGKTYGERNKRYRENFAVN